MRIAVVGTGVSGLVAAHLLHPRHDVTLYEREEHVGGHSHTVDVPTRDGPPVSVDTGFIVFNHRTYPAFTALLDELGVASEPSSMGFSVRCDRTGIEYAGASLSTLYAQRRNLLRAGHHRMVIDLLRFYRDARRALEAIDDRRTLGEFLDAAGYSASFRDRHILPMAAAIWSVSPAQVLDFPTRFVLRFFDNHGMIQLRDRPVWRVVTGGSARYVEALTRPFRDRIRTATAVSAVRRGPMGVSVHSERFGTETFDHVVIACHADQALRLLADATETERALLSATEYRPNQVWLHTDARVLPRNVRLWSSWNYRVPERTSDQVTLTYHMNTLQNLDSPTDYCVTLNPSPGEIDPARVIARFVYDHPVFTHASAGAQARHREVVAANRTSFCGAYWGFGFHEDGVQSAIRVVREIESKVPAGAIA